MAKTSHNNLSVTRKAGAANNPNDSSSPAIAVQTELKWINGPIPSADELARYEAVLSGSAERLLQLHERQISLVEEQAHHRFHLEKCVVEGDAKRSYAGMILGFALSAGVLTAAYSLGIHGHDWLAGTFVTLDITGMASMFIYGTNTRRAERAERAKMLTAEANQHSE